jgi:hypothetical protein
MNGIIIVYGAYDLFWNWIFSVMFNMDTTCKIVGWLKVEILEGVPH